MRSLFMKGDYMKEEHKEKLEQDLNNDLNNFDNYGFNDQEKSKAINIIAKEVAILSAEEKEKRDNERFVWQKELDKAKFEFEKDVRLTQLQNDTEFRKAELELKKTSLELEIKKAKDDEKRNKAQFWISIAGVALPCLVDIIAKCIYAGLAVNAQKHDYEEYKLESASSKEQRNNLLKK